MPNFSKYSLNYNNPSQANNQLSNNRNRFILIHQQYFAGSSLGSEYRNKKIQNNLTQFDISWLRLITFHYLVPFNCAYLSVTTSYFEDILWCDYSGKSAFKCLLLFETSIIFFGSLKFKCYTDSRLLYRMLTYKKIISYSVLIGAILVQFLGLFWFLALTFCLGAALLGSVLF